MNKYLNYNTPLLLQTCALVSYVMVLIFFYLGDRNIFHFPIMLASSIALDVFLQKIFSKKLLKINMSVFISTSACYLLITTDRLLWPYLAAAWLAVISKYFFKFDNKHIYNPANFGIFIIICFFSDKAMINLAQWFSDIPTTLLFIFIGAYVSFISKRITLSASYILTIIILRYFKYLNTGINPTFLIGPLLNMATFIFTFHMITDPKTSPDKKSHQIIFGVLIASLDFVLRENQIIFAPLLSLLIICTLSPMIFTQNRIQLVSK